MPRAKEKVRSAEALRVRLVEWLRNKGGEELSRPEHNGVLGRVIGGDWRLMTRAGWLRVHLPSDAPCTYANYPLSGFEGKCIGLLSINTRFEDWPAGSLPSDANPHSGKWCFSCYVSEERLFADFTTLAGRLLHAHG